MLLRWRYILRLPEGSTTPGADAPPQHPEEASILKANVRDLEVGVSDARGAEGEDVDVDGAGAPMRAAAAAEGGFDLLTDLEQPARIKIRQHRDDLVQVRTLTGWAADGVGLGDGRPRDDARAALTEQAARRAQQRAAITGEVGAEREVCARHRGVSADDPRLRASA